MKKALYQQIEEYILDSIRKHDIREGEGLPSERDLARLFNSSHIPVRRATQDLIDRGVLYRINGKGTFVKPRDTGARKRTTRRIGVLHCHDDAGFIHSPFYAPILAGIEQELYERERVPMISALFKDDDVFAQAYGIADEVDGFILVDARPGYEDRILDALGRFGKPAVVVNYARDLEGIDGINVDNYGNIKKITSMLIDNGHARIGYVYSENETAVHPNNTLRLQGYRDALRDRGIGYDGALVTNYIRSRDKMAVIDEFRQRKEAPPVAAAQDRMFAALVGGARPVTAVVCAYDGLAVRVLEQARTHGLRVPDDLSVTGHDDTVVAGPVGLTTVYTPLIGMGKRAVRRLLEKIEEKREGAESITRTVLPGELVLRSTHGLAPRS